MRTTIDFNFDFYQTIDLEWTHKHGNQEKLFFVYLQNYNFKKLVRNQNLNSLDCIDINAGHAVWLS